MKKINDKIIVITGPSGAGKTTLANHLLEQDLPISFPVSYTTRPKRESEVEGKDFYFTDKERFKEMVSKNEFFEWKEVYTNLFYGHSYDEIKSIHDAGITPLLVINVDAAVDLEDLSNDAVLTIMIQGDDLEDLRRRLEERGEKKENIEERMKTAEEELGYEDKFDFVIENKYGEVEKAKQEIEKIVIDFLN